MLARLPVVLRSWVCVLMAPVDSASAGRGCVVAPTLSLGDVWQRLNGPGRARANLV